VAAKIKGISDNKGSPPAVFVFWCPGCEDVHPYRVTAHAQEPRLPVWKFNGSVERPTFTPSLLVNGSGQGRRCHLFLTDGVLHFCEDSQHKLAGQAVPCPDWDDERW
jgi:hypothetical protein